MVKDVSEDPDFEPAATPEEVHSAWMALSAPDRKKLAAYAATLARLYQFADPGMTWEDLMQAADVLVLYGQRTWKMREISFLEFMFGILRSVAGDLKRTKAGKVRAASSHEEPENLDLADTDDPVAILIAREQEEHTRAIILALQVEFEHDEHPFYVLECLLEGLRPREVRARLNMTAKDFDAARKKIDRRCRKLLRPN